MSLAQKNAPKCLAFLLVVSSCGCTLFQRQESSLIDTVPLKTLDKQNLAQCQSDLAVASAEAAEQQGKTDQAIQFYEQARTLDAKWNHLCRRLAVLYDQRGDDDRAQAAYEQAIALAPQDPELLNDYGVFYLQRDQWPQAETWFKKAIAAQPGHERATINLAITLATQGRAQESYEHFAKIVGPAAAYSNLGVLLARQGKTAEARTHFLRALEIDNQLPQARAFLAHLDGLTQPAHAPQAPSLQQTGTKGR